MLSRTRGYLPHIVRPESTYFVTFRLADSLPASVLMRFKTESAFAENMKSRYEEAIHKYLDACYGQCWLKNPDIALLVSNAIRYFDHNRYELFALALEWMFA